MRLAKRVGVGVVTALEEERAAMLAMLDEVGFTHVRRTLLSFGIAQLITATRGNG